MFKKYKIRLLSRLRTPLQSDTIFGHLCWAIKYLEGENRLISFLNEMKSEPLIKISCAFPEGYLPKPVLKSMSQQELKEVAKDIGKGTEDEQEALFKGLVMLKSIKKMAFIPIKVWQKHRKNFIEKLLVLDLVNEAQAPFSHSRVHPHNTISRTKGVVLEEGGLYFEREWWIPANRCFDLYVWFKNKEIKELWDRVWKDYIEVTGFGKDKSTGAGQIKIYEDNSFDEDIFRLDNANAWMSLSLIAFKKLRKIDVYYKPLIKFGKLGGDFALSSPLAGAVNPFKKPLIMLEPGSVFYGKEPPSGDLLEAVHVDKRICHYGYGIFIPFCHAMEN